MGEGWKKTKAYQIVEGVAIPDKWSGISWLEIAQYYDEYGIEVAALYADTKTAGIVARQTAQCYGKIYQTIKDLIPPNFDNAFFECLSVDHYFACLGYIMFDIISTDNKLAKIDNDYNNKLATYKGVPCSMHEYIKEKYGVAYVEIINRLNACL